jgi:hypothetical protein
MIARRRVASDEPEESLDKKTAAPTAQRFSSTFQ